MTDGTWIDYLKTIATLLTPVLLAIYTVVAKRQQDRIERIAHLEDQLHDDRVTIYEKILEPFIILLMSDEAWEADSRNKGRKNTMLPRASCYLWTTSGLPSN